MFIFLTRLGTESKAVINGDPTQIDLPHNKKSGMVEALAALRDIEGSAFANFSDCDVIRHELVQEIVGASRTPPAIQPRTGNRIPSRSKGRARGYGLLQKRRVAALAETTAPADAGGERQANDNGGARGVERKAGQ